MNFKPHSISPSPSAKGVTPAFDVGLVRQEVILRLGKAMRAEAAMNWLPCCQPWFQGCNRPEALLSQQTQGIGGRASWCTHEISFVRAFRRYYST